MDEKHIVVLGSAHEPKHERTRLEAYLYSHADVVGDGAVPRYYGAIVRVTAEHDIDFLTSYQASRLSSGGFFARVVPSITEARSELNRMVGIQIASE